MQQDRDIQSVLSRIDERLNNLLQRQTEVANRQEKALEHFADLDSRVRVIESRNGHALEEILDQLHRQDNRISVLEVYNAGNLAKWGRITDAALKLVIAIVLAFLLFKLGWK